MRLRFYRRVHLLPGVRLNVTTRGASCELRPDDVRVSPPLKCRALHEAAHAVLQVMLGIGCKRVTIVPDHDSSGSAFHAGRCPAKELEAEGYWRRQATQCYAGAEAQRRMGLRFWRAGTGS